MLNAICQTLGICYRWRYVHVAVAGRIKQPVEYWEYNNINSQLNVKITIFYLQLQPAEHVSGDIFAHPQEHWTVFTVCGIKHRRCCVRAGSGRTPSWSCSQAVSKPVWHIPLLCVRQNTPDDGQRNRPKHVEFYSKNKFEKLVYLVGFIIRSKNEMETKSST